MPNGSSRSPYAPALPGAIVHGLSIVPLVLLLGWYWATPGVVRNLDWHVHVCWIGGYADALAHGVPYPRWIDTPNAGLGAPVFLLYPPLSHFLGAVAALASDATVGLKAVVSLATLMQFLGARSWFMLHTSRGDVGLLAAAFCVAPQVVAPGYWFNMPATALGLACAAWTLSLLDPLRVLSLRQLAGLGLASGALLLTHLPTALTAMPAMGALVLAAARMQPAEGGRRLGALLVGTLLAAPYLLAAWLSADLMNSGFLRENPLWRIEQNLWPLAGDPLTRALAENAIWFRLAAYWGLSLALAAVLMLQIRRRLDGTAVLLAGVAALCFALMFDISQPLYEAVPALQWLQFGWRWQGLFLLVALGLVARALGHTQARRSSAIGLGILLGLALLSALGPQPQAAFWGRARTSPAEGDRAAARCLWDTLEHRPRSMGDHWQLDSRELPQSLQVLDGRTHVLAATRSPHARQYRLHVDFPGRVRLDALAFPGWVAERNGRLVETLTSDAGLIEMDLPAGSHHLQLRYRAPLPVRVSEAVSVLLLGLLAWLLVRGSRPVVRRCNATRDANRRRG